jgi:hypothetical protein
MSELVIALWNDIYPRNSKCCQILRMVQEAVQDMSERTCSISKGQHHM